MINEVKNTKVTAVSKLRCAHGKVLVIAGVLLTSATKYKLKVSSTKGWNKSREIELSAGIDPNNN